MGNMELLFEAMGIDSEEAKEAVVAALTAAGVAITEFANGTYGSGEDAGENFVEGVESGVKGEKPDLITKI